jgi:hypothetical protein
MKLLFLKLPLLLALTLTFSWRAAADDDTKFSGTVVDAQGRPVAGATVDYYQYASGMGFGRDDLAAKHHATTDGQGAFEFSMSDGMGLVLVTKAGFAPGWQSWYQQGAQDQQKIILATSSVLAGMVVDDAGQPVADAEVWVPSALNKTMTDSGQPNFVFGKIARDLFSTRTSSDGKFRIENFPADAQAMLAVKKAGKAQRPATSQTRYDELPFHAGQEDITLTLDPAGSVAGKVVVRETGQPLGHVVVGLQPATPRMGVFFPDRVTSVSAADGSFQISNVPAGSYRVTANFTNEPIADWVADLVPVTVAAGATVSGVQIQADSGGVLEVTVRSKKNHALLADVGVSVNSEGYNHGASTGTNGVAYFRLPPGQFNLFVMKQDWSQAQAEAAVIEKQTARVTVELEEPFKVAGIVRDAAGAPVAGAIVGVFPDYGNGRVSAKTDANGHYETSWQKPAWVGSQNQGFFLVARHSERKLAGMMEIGETTTNLNVTLQPAMSVSGRVQDAQGRHKCHGLYHASFGKLELRIRPPTGSSR